MVTLGNESGILKQSEKPLNVKQHQIMLLCLCWEELNCDTPVEQ